DPRMRVVIGDRPRARALVVGPAREADGDARRDAEVAEHQRHRAREVLAVAALRLHDEADERWRSRLRWMLVVLEAAARAEPRLDADRCPIPLPRAPCHPARGLRARLVRLQRRAARDERIEPALASGRAAPRRGHTGL